MTPQNTRKLILTYLAFVAEDGATMEQISARLHPGSGGIASGVAAHLDALTFTGQVWRRDDGRWLHGEYRPRDREALRVDTVPRDNVDNPDSELQRCLMAIRRAGVFGASAPVISARTRIPVERVEAAILALSASRHIQSREGRMYRGKPSVIWIERKPDGDIARRIVDVLTRHDRAIPKSVIVNRIPAYSESEISACLDDMARDGKVLAIMPEHDFRHRKRTSVNRVWVYALPKIERGA